jgi:hypothetical protein
MPINMFNVKKIHFLLSGHPEKIYHILRKGGTFIFILSDQGLVVGKEDNETRDVPSSNGTAIKIIDPW